MRDKRARRAGALRSSPPPRATMIATSLPDDLRRAVRRLDRGDLAGAKRVTRRVVRRCSSLPSATVQYIALH